MKGDIHGLGKNILAALLRAHGFEVYDLGVDVTPAMLVERVVEVESDFVGFSALIASAFPSMKEAADMIQESNLSYRPRIMVGGGVTTPNIKAYVGADFQTIDATEGVAYCMAISRENRDG